MNIAKEIIKRACARQFRVEVDDGDGRFVDYRSFQPSWQAIIDVEQARVRIYTGSRWEYLLVINSFLVGNHETAADMSVGGWIANTWDQLNGPGAAAALEGLDDK